MSGDYDRSRLDVLIRLLLDGGLGLDEKAELNGILNGSAEARAVYRAAMEVHAALIRHAAGSVVFESAPVVRKPAAGRIVWIGGLAAAACVAVGAWLVLPGPAPAPVPLARLSGTSGEKWAEGHAPGAPGDDSLSLDRPLNLVSGFAELTFRSGVRVVLEGPCRFHVTAGNSMHVGHGRASVRVPAGATGFHLDTPGGRITDFGTEFGVAVGSSAAGPIVLTQVFEGEIEVPGDTRDRKRMLSGDALAIVRDEGKTRLVSESDGYRVDLKDSARVLPEKRPASGPNGNLALGKPVTSPDFYARKLGSVFPPENLTDGRLNDSGSPGDWSYWLAPNEDSGEFTVDLGEPMLIDRVEMQNTRNRAYGDRGTREFLLLVAGEDEVFTQVAGGELREIAELSEPGVDFPFESFTFGAVRARYVRVVIVSHYRRADRPPENPNHGGGLNEIRIFGP